MLKAKVKDRIWLVQQHHHAQISGFLAAHWGGSNGFVRPGDYPGATDPIKCRDEVILGIAEHDNGWWSSEALPRFSAQDGLPVGVGDAAPPTRENEFGEWRSGGFDRWRTGIERLSGAHPYAALLVSLHAYWLYAVAFDDLRPSRVGPVEHPVFGSPEVAAGLVGDEQVTRTFLADQESVQGRLKERLRGSERWARAIEPDHLDAHVRLLQLMDSMSLFLSLADPKEHVLGSVPRSSWNDLCSIRWSRPSARTVILDPYPFDSDSLTVHLPVREVPVEHDSEAPFALLHGTPLKTAEFTFRSA